MLLNFKGSQKLKKEIVEWVNENIITSKQADILYKRYELLKEAPYYLRSNFILRGVALVLAGLGLLLLISENWNQFGILIRMSIAAIPMLISYMLGFKFLYENKKDEAELAFFFGSITFGINIFLQAQIFHISAYYPNGILWWMIGVLPMAIFFKSKLHNFLLIIFNTGAA